ncbi:MAG TPA: Trm112 family protein [Acidilobales archaeon]|nr:Trm112 family protein [Acidilobales archaeon]
MRYALLNLLACPMCKNFPLKLYVFERKTIEKHFKVKKPFCDLYCGLKESYIKDLNVNELNCDECVRIDIISGVIVCNKCGRWYPIIDGIPWMYPDSRRRHPRIKSKEEEFIKKYYELLPNEVKSKLKAGTP